MESARIAWQRKMFPLSMKPEMGELGNHRGMGGDSAIRWNANSTEWTVARGVMGVYNWWRLMYRNVGQGLALSLRGWVFPDPRGVDEQAASTPRIGLRLPPSHLSRVGILGARLSIYPDGRDRFNADRGFRGISRAIGDENPVPTVGARSDSLTRVMVERRQGVSRHFACDR